MSVNNTPREVNHDALVEGLSRVINTELELLVGKTHPFMLVIPANAEFPGTVLTNASQGHQMLHLTTVVLVNALAQAGIAKEPPEPSRIVRPVG